MVNLEGCKQTYGDNVFPTALSVTIVLLAQMKVLKCFTVPAHYSLYTECR